MKHTYHHPSETIGRPRQGYRDDARSEGSGACTRSMMTDEQRKELDALTNRKLIRRGAVGGKLVPAFEPKSDRIIDPIQPKEIEHHDRQETRGHTQAAR